MDRATAKALRNKLNEVFEQHGIDGYSIHVGNASYDDAQVTFKVEVREEGASSKEERDLETFARIDGLDTKRLTFDPRSGKTFVLVGYKTRARKNPWIVQDMNTGTKYVINDMTAKRWFAKDIA